MSELFFVGESPIHGKGVFAKRDISKGETICFMRGESIDTLEVQRRYESGEERESDPLQVGEKEYLDLEEPYVFINHSCSPNAYMNGKNELKALKEIKKGEEITYDYSLTEWTDDSLWGDEYEEVWTMECGCGSKECRGVVTEFDYLPKELIEKHLEDGDVQDFIKRKAKGLGYV